MFVSDPALLHREFAESRSKNEDYADVLSEAVAFALLKDIQRRMTPQPLKIRADVEMTCFEYDGVVSIKSAMRSAEAVSTDYCKVEMNMVASPLYVLSTQSSERDVGIALVNHAIEVLRVSGVEYLRSESNVLCRITSPPTAGNWW